MWYAAPVAADIVAEAAAAAYGAAHVTH